MSDNELDGISGGLPVPGSNTVLCGARVICYDNGLSSCIAYFNCADINDEYNRNNCGTYNYVIEETDGNYIQELSC